MMTMAESSATLATPAPASTTVTAPSSRVLSVDVLRGITIAFMILVNDAGDGKHVYTQLEHAAWNGCTLTDLVFPTFLFIVGIAIILSIHSRLQRGASRSELAMHTVRRAATIFVVAMLINLVPYFNFTRLRIYGVLPRIALCYLIVGLICLTTQKARNLLAITAALLVSYWLLMRFVPVPGFGVPTHDIPLLDPDRNLAAWMDRGIMGFLQNTIYTGRLYEGTRDPEGLLSTIPAVGTTLLGAVTALWLRRAGGKSPSITRAQCALGMLLAGLVGIGAGLVWDLWFPLNKKLWTSSYVLFAAGCALVGLAVCYWLIDMRRFQETTVGRVMTWPWLVFGSNAIVAYVVAAIVEKTLFLIHVSGTTPDGKPLTGWGWVYWHLFASHGSTQMTSAMFAFAFVLVCFIPNWILWRKKIFVKL
ncbi:MAG TPA: heparan-alpha-glucosaminide N-acetyltransferase domain-containing protein [Edaphobacter sp.]|nr:heparan-alpha-glucosaminide N-acetyltransferase domain-containing protein [Edaphobacter sp.]